MTNLQTFEKQINGDIQRYRTAVNFATGTEEEKAAKQAEAFAELESKVTATREDYEQYRTGEIERTEKERHLFRHPELKHQDSKVAKSIADKFYVELIAAEDAQAQNNVLRELEDTLKYFEDGAKFAFYEHIPMINSLLVDKAASKGALQAVIAEMKDYVNPYEVWHKEAQELPTVIGEDFDTIKAELEQGE